MREAYFLKRGELILGQVMTSSSTVLKAGVIPIGFSKSPALLVVGKD
jgi:hypothetical protein